MATDVFDDIVKVTINGGSLRAPLDGGSSPTGDDVGLYILDAGSPSVVPGDVVCNAGLGKVTKGLTTPLTNAKIILGIALNAASPGQSVSVQTDNLVGPDVTGIASDGYVKANVTTGRCEVIAGAYEEGDFAVGVSYASWLQISRIVSVGTPPTPPFDYASIGGLVADYNGNVGFTPALWTDQSSAGNNLVQATGGSQPTNGGTALNSKATVRFDGTDDVMSCASFALGTGEFTLFTVLALRASPADNVVLGYDTATLFYQCTAAGQPLLKRSSTNTFYNHDVTGEGFHIWNGESRVGGGNEIWFDNVSRDAQTNATALPTSAPLDIGNYSGGGFAAAIDVARILIYNKPLTGPQRNSVANALALEYALTI